MQPEISDYAHSNDEIIIIIKGGGGYVSGGYSITFTSGNVVKFSVQTFSQTHG